MKMKGSRNFVELRSCINNPKCCYDTHDLECPNKFNPPLLSTSAEFCTEALAKGIPIPKCVLAKPKKLQIEREPPPLAKPATSRHLKNWQRWCYIWRQTYNKLTANRNTEFRPPVMSSGEVHRIKKEDKELFDRTLHAYHLNGFYIKNAQFPDSIRPKPCGGNADMKEVVTKRYVRDFPEMKRHRYPNYVRNEVSLPPRKAPSKKTANNTATNKVQMRGPVGFNWEEQWANTKHVEKMKDMLACDIGLYGKTDPIPDNLIFKQLQLKDGPAERIQDKNNDRQGKNVLLVPQLVFSSEPVEENADEIGDNLSHHSTGADGWYSEKRGPVLRIRSQFSEQIMTYSNIGIDFPHFIGNPATSFVSADGESTTNESTYFYDDDHHFSITTKCKDTKLILLKNEGTTGIRYQWFRSPPTYDAQQMLEDPTQFKHIRLETNDSQQKNDDLDSIVGGATTASQSENPLKKVSKKSHLEFHFCSLPGIILPGQSLEFPIIFRSKRPGFFHETLYLLTHPRVVSTNGRSYAVRLSGVCTDVELAEPENEHHEMETLKRFLSQRAMEEETKDLMDSILDRALWEATNTAAKGSSLPNGRVTAESIFSSHNQEYYYHFGKSEKALELVRQLIEMLVPTERVETQAHCDLSLQSLYNLVLSAREENDLHWAQLRSSQCEELLEKLDTECMLTLSEQRTFAWPNTERRKYTACYSNLVGTFDEVLLGFDRLHNLYNAPAIKLIDQRKAEQLVEDYLRKEQEKQDRLTLTNIMDESGDEMFEAFGETEVDNVPPLTELQVMSSEMEGMTIDEEEEIEEEKIPYWLAAFEEMMRPYNRPTSSPLQPQLSPSPEKSRKQPAKVRDDLDLLDTATDMEAKTSTDPLVASRGSGVGGSGDAEISSESAKVEKRRESTAPTLQETMQKQVEMTRRRVLTEARVKLFEDVLCAGIERMLATVDNFNNMLDYRDTDVVVLIDNNC